MITLKNVSKSFGSIEVLKSINLEFEGGKNHIILGESGCGKSTLLRLILGLTPATGGEVRVGDEVVSKESTRRIREKIGYVLQNAGLFPHMSAFENIALVARIKNWTEEKIRSRVDELGAMVGLERELLLKFPRQLSGGQKQRIGLMRALVLDPPILLFDEPLGALDPVIRMQLQEDLLRIFDHLKKTVLMVTHDINEAAYLGNSVTLLKDGRVLQHGRLEELAQDPSDGFVTQFLVAQRPAPVIREIL